MIVDVLFEDGLLFLSVRNISSEPARDVAVTFDRRIRGSGGTQDVTALPLFRSLTFLAPGKEIRAFVDASRSYFRREEPEVIAATVAFRDVRGRAFSARIVHDLSIYRDLCYVSARESAGARAQSAPSPTEH